MTDELSIERQAKLAEIAMRLTWYLPVDEQAIILAVGPDTASPTPYRVTNNNGVTSVSLVLADGSVRHLASELDEPLADGQ
jgi:hypothetical protein